MCRRFNSASAQFVLVHLQSQVFAGLPENKPLKPINRETVRFAVVGRGLPLQSRIRAGLVRCQANHPSTCNEAAHFGFHLFWFLLMHAVKSDRQIASAQPTTLSCLEKLERSIPAV